MHREYSRESAKRLRAAAREMGAALSLADVEAFHHGCRVDGSWFARGHMRARALRLVAAGLVADPFGWQMFGHRMTEATLTPAGRGLWWRVEEVYAETMPMLRAAFRQQGLEAAAERAP